MTIQVPHQWIFKIKSSRDPRVFPRDMPSIMPVNPLFVYSNGDSSESTTTNKSVEAKLAFEKYATTFGVKIQKYHSDKWCLNYRKYLSGSKYQNWVYFSATPHHL